MHTDLHAALVPCSDGTCISPCSKEPAYHPVRIAPSLHCDSTWLTIVNLVRKARKFGVQEHRSMSMAFSRTGMVLKNYFDKPSTNLFRSNYFKDTHNSPAWRLQTSWFPIGAMGQKSAPTPSGRKPSISGTSGRDGRSERCLRKSIIGLQSPLCQKISAACFLMFPAIKYLHKKSQNCPNLIPRILYHRR